MKVPFPSNETERLAALYQYNLLDTAPEQVFDDLTLLAAHICDTPIALITLIDADRQWFKSKFGLTLTEISRELALCNHTILEVDELFIVPDTLADERFATHPFVISDPEIRFYAGASLTTEDGYALGTLCVLDRKPRQLTADQIAVLQALRRATITEVQMHRNVETLARTLTERDQAYIVLQELKDELELEVQARTDELQALNERLQLELTERKRAEEALVASEERFQMAMQSAIDAIIIADKAGFIVSWNRGAQIMFGYTEAEAIGQPITLLMPQEFRERHQAGILRYNSTGQKRVIDQTVELQGRRKDGDVFPLELSLSVRSAGEETFFSGIIRDITERKQAEAQIRQNAARAEALARIAARLNAQLDLETVLSTVCEEAARALNISATTVRLYNEQRDELYYASSCGLPLEYQGVVPPWPRTDYEKVQKQQGNFIVTPEAQANVYNPDTQLYAALDIRSGAQVRMEREGQLIGILTVCTLGEIRNFSEDELILLKGLADQAAQAIANARLLEAVREERALLAQRVTERTKELSTANAELARTARAKDEFLAGMSHELRTPLSAILGLTEVLQEQTAGPLNEYQLKSLHIIEESGRHLLALINDILDLSKIEADELNLQLSTVPLETICQVSLQFVKQAALKKKIQLLSRLDNPSALIQIDTRRFKQILVNLLSNAVKFTPEGGQVGLEVVEEPDQKRFQFTVWDTGIGIAPEHLPQLFKPFVQIDSSLSREYEGTGLGLALVYRLVELHGGTISVFSEPNQGSRFTIFLPQIEICEAVEDPEPVEIAPKVSSLPQDPVEAGSASLKENHPLILLAEDNEDNIRIFGNYLEATGYRLVVARNGLEAIDRAREVSPALILMDIQIPKMDGLQVIGHLRGEPQLAGIPIIALTALAMSGDRERCLAAGANDYLSKPVSLKNLTKAIEAQLKPPVPAD